jgi:hypothetical protein
MHVEPRFGGKACPHYSETRPCNVVPCGCNTAGGFKRHGTHYAGFGKNYCNQCRCHAGTEHCTKRACGVPSSAQICDKTTCKYGAVFGNNYKVLAPAEAVAIYGKNWASRPHEMTTLVKHHSRDANGAKFSCGHVMHTDQCKCYCSNGKAPSHIWHRAKRHADTIRLGQTSAGCKCQSSWSFQGKRYSGCVNPKVTPNPLLQMPHGGKREAWCKIVPGSCVSYSPQRVIPAGSDWDTCSELRHFKIHVALP